MTMVHARSWRHGLGITFLLLACVVLLCACEAGAPPEHEAEEGRSSEMPGTEGMPTPR